ncbi:MAG: 3'-5' exonuclease [Muribaculaceae bacterium]|nr:3'-5' exonuclease [Muribaculaceae bacterium]
MENFAAIDFETANLNKSSICSVGIVVVRNSIITNKYYSLINPIPNYYSYWNTKIHGLSDVDTRDARCFRDIWIEVEPIIQGLPFVAHNSSFDEACLKEVFRVYQMDYPDYKFHCTYRASQRKFGKILPNHQLQTVAEHCGYKLVNHHNALSDAEATAIIAMKII